MVRRLFIRLSSVEEPRYSLGIWLLTLGVTLTLLGTASGRTFLHETRFNRSTLAAMTTDLSPNSRLPAPDWCSQPSSEARMPKMVAAGLRWGLTIQFTWLD